MKKKIIEDTKEIAVQVNGKVRGTVQIGTNEEEESIKEKACTEIDYPASRRVEIKFRLSDEGQIDNIVKMMQEQLNK